MLAPLAQTVRPSPQPTATRHVPSASLSLTNRACLFLPVKKGADFYWPAQHLYGSNRIGIFKPELDLLSMEIPTPTTKKQLIGKRAYDRALPKCFLTRHSSTWEERPVDVQAREPASAAKLNPI